MKDWDAIYRERGMVQKNPSEQAIEAIKFFKEKNLKKILDLGCGTGRHTELLTKENFEVFGCDNSKSALDFIKEKIPLAKVELGDMVDLPYEDNFFDGILCYQVIQHGKTKTVKKAISEIHRTLKKGGYLFLVVISTKHPKFQTGKEIEPNTKINTADIDGDIPHHFFSKEDMTEFFKDFKIINLTHFETKSEVDNSKNSASWVLYAERV